MPRERECMKEGCGGRTMSEGIPIIWFHAFVLAASLSGFYMFDLSVPAMLNI